MQTVSRAYRFIGSFLTFLVAFLAISNYSSYTNAAEELEILRPQLEQTFYDQLKAFGEQEDVQSLLEGYQKQFTEVLTTPSYRTHSLFKIIGCLIALVGIVFLRRLRSVGLHLFIAGMVLCIGAGWYVYGLTFIGVFYTILYILFTVVVSIYYWTQRGFWVS